MITRYKPFIVIIIIILIFFAVIHKSKTNIYENISDTNKLKISASFYPLAEFAKQVAGNDVEIITITPKGAEPHDFEPTRKDILNISTSDVFIFNGSKFDPWAEEIASILNKKGVLTINITERLDSGSDDPHTWLDPILAEKSVEIIRDELKIIDAHNRYIYDENTEIYTKKLLALNKKYSENLQVCETRYAITSHGAFGYIADRYNIEIIPISGVSPDSEPSARRLGEIVKLAILNEITYIFSEPLISSKLAETIANEVGAEILYLNPIESLTEKEETLGKNYISIMEDNLYNLQTALRCRQ